MKRNGNGSSSNSHHTISSLKPLQNLQPMARLQLADISPTNQTLLNMPFGNQPPPLHLGFQAA